MRKPSSRCVRSSPLAALLTLLALAPAAQAQHTFFAFNSTPGSWVGQGFTNYHISPATNWAFTANTIASHNYVGLHAHRLDPNPPENNRYWDLDLAAPSGQPLQAGFYDNAARWPFQGPTQPGMTLSGNSRGNNVNTGWFHVLEAEYSGTTVVRFAVDFRQYDEGDPNNYVDGEWRFNSTIPEPSAGAVAALTALPLLRRRRRR